MTKKTLLLGVLYLLLVCSASWAQDQEENQNQVNTGETWSSCSLIVKATVAPVDSLARSGHAVIKGFLCDKESVPIANQEVHLKVNCGTLTCKAPDAPEDTNKNSSSGSCLITGQDGTFTLYLANIPFITRGRVDATCTYQNFTVKAFSTFLITRNTIRKVTVTHKKVFHPVKPGL
ncbi:MAG: hypothetical protein PHC61_01240 [Chitinivibrionales bacterium]|nr:hypothetical protein [Chitinivibrionales bacterium]